MGFLGGMESYKFGRTDDLENPAPLVGEHDCWHGERGVVCEIHNRGRYRQRRVDSTTYDCPRYGNRAPTTSTAPMNTRSPLLTLKFIIPLGDMHLASCPFPSVALLSEK